MPGVFMSIRRKRDALLRARLAAGAHQAEDPVGVLPQRVPGLLSVDDVMIALAHGAGPQRSKIGAGARLGIALAPPVFAGNDPRQEVILLRGVGECHQHRGNHSQRKGKFCGGAPAAARFLLENVLLDDAPAGAAEALRPHPGAPTAAVQNLLPAHQIVFAYALCRDASCREFRREARPPKRPALQRETTLLPAV